MMLNIGTTVATVNIAFSTSRNAALIEPRMLQYTTLSTKLPQCILSDIKHEIFTKSEVPACLSIHCADQEQHSNHSNLDFLTKSDNVTLQTCINIAFENLLA